jgi:leader peptidase (prepilin peptidase)/N-methyltransferase
VPNALGGGDIKFMFAAGLYLGLYGVLRAIPAAFIAASIAGILLLLFKIKKAKEYIPFGPFLALGSFIAFYFS